MNTKENEMLKLYRFHWDCGRMGDVTGVFVEDDATVAKAIGKEVYFGEILGKHSEIVGPLNETDLTVLTDDQEFIAKAKKYGLSGFGHNPIATLRENGEL
jgi:hypothetical protein